MASQTVEAVGSPQKRSPTVDPRQVFYKFQQAEASSKLKAFVDIDQGARCTS